MSQARQWKCDVCGYIHNGPEPPKICPVCGVGPEFFSPVHESDPSGEQPAPASQRDVAQTRAWGRDAIVIIGGGAAGLAAAEHARKAAPEAPIVLVHKEPDLPYNRLNLTRLLAGEVEESALALRDEGWYASHAIQTLQGTVLRILRDPCEIELRDGRRFPYYRLILANGAHPFVPPLLGVTRGNVGALRTKRDALEILARARPGSPCACVGGGLLGLEVAGALSRRGMSVSVLEGAQQLLPRQLARSAAERLQRHLEGLGIRFFLEARSQEILGDEEARAVRLASGDEVPAEVVLLATGIRPNSDLARQCGLEVGRGVVVDDHMQSSDPRIFAAGDVAEHAGTVYGLWPTAMAQGAVAGASAAGGREKTFQGAPPATQLKVVDLPLYSIGEFEPSDASYSVHEHQGESSYYRLVAKDGRLVGANLLGDIEGAAVVQAAVEDKAPLAEVRSRFDGLPALRGCLEGNG